MRARTRALSHLILLITLIFSFNSMANCRDVNLYEDQNNVLHSMEIIDQGELNTCYAYTAAQMIEYHMRDRMGLEKKVEGLWLALVHKLNRRIHWKPNDLDYSLLEWAIKDIKKYGNCHSPNFLKDLERAKAGNEVSNDDFVYFLKLVFKRYKKLQRKRSTRKNALRLAYEQMLASSDYREQLAHSVWPVISKMAGYKKRHFLRYLRDKVVPSCETREGMNYYVPEMYSTARSYQSDEKIQRVLSNALTSDIPQPVGLGYCSNILRNDPGQLALMKRPRLLNMVLKLKKCSAHYSVIVGQRDNGGRCEYLIRNTYGKQFYGKKRQCYCSWPSKASMSGGKLQREQGACDENNRPNGAIVLGCWVDGKELAQNTFDLTFFLR